MAHGVPPPEVVPSDTAACPEGAHAQLDALNVCVIVLAHRRRSGEEMVLLCARGREGLAAMASQCARLHKGMWGRSDMGWGGWG